MHKFYVGVAAFLLTLLISLPLCAQSYTATELYGTLNETYATGINDSGMVVGYSGIARTDALLWSPNGSRQVLGTLGGKYAQALAINNLGQVVGWSSLAGNSSYHAFLWTQAGGMQDLGFEVSPNAINDNTEIVGYYEPVQNVWHAFLWTQAGGLQDLGTLGGTNSQAYGINAAGHVTGSAEGADGTNHAFLWTAQGGMQELVPGETFPSGGAAINDSDQVVGTLLNSQDNENHAFLWSQATGMQDLGTIRGGWSGASAINNSGDVVGDAGKPGNYRHCNCFSVVWPQGGALEKLVPPLVPKGLALSKGATGINSSGQVAANGVHEPFLLTPKKRRELPCAIHLQQANH